MRKTKTMELIYEVTLIVDPKIEDSFSEWLKSHVDEMVSLQWFRDAKIFRLDEKDQHGWVVHYYPHSKTQLDSYLKVDAPRMRSHGLEMFGDQFAASRRILNLV